MKRVVITGMGAITPIGNSVEEFWNNVKNKKVGIGELSKFDTTDFSVKLAGEVKDFNPRDFMDFKNARRMEPFSQFAIAATKQAIEESGLDLEKEDLTRIGTCIGSGIGSLQTIQTEYKKILEGHPNKVHVLMIPKLISNMAAGNVAINFGLKGKCTNVVTACATGTHSIGEAFRSIQANEVDVMVAGGTEAPICESGVAGFTALDALTSATDPHRASIPFDKERSGVVIAEGAAVLVLESLEHAQKRGAKILAEIVGYGATCDAYHITSPQEDGDGAARAMLFAINEAGINKEDVDYINAHGTSTHLNDLFETRAIKKALGDHAYNVNINSTKSMTGHMLGAAGAIEAITCVKSIQDSYVHATVGYSVKDEELDLNYTPEAVENKEINYALSNSLGFGGHNASILIKKYTE